MSGRNCRVKCIRETHIISHFLASITTYVVLSTTYVRTYVSTCYQCWAHTVVCGLRTYLHSLASLAWDQIKQATVAVGAQHCTTHAAMHACMHGISITRRYLCRVSSTTHFFCQIEAELQRSCTVAMSDAPLFLAAVCDHGRSRRLKVEYR